LGRFVGFGESVGDALTFKILTDDTQKIMYRSSIRTALFEEEREDIGKQADRNVRAEPALTESPTTDTPVTALPVPAMPPEIVCLPVCTKADGTKRYMSTISPDELVTRAHLTEPDDNGQRIRAKIVKRIVDLEQSLQEHPDCTQFLVTYEGINRLDEIVAYNQVLEALEDQLLDDPNDYVTYWTFQDIIAHEGPLTPGSPSYKGSGYNVLVAWEDGSQTYEPLHVMAADSPTVCAIYAERAELLDTPGSKRFKRLASRTKAMERQLNTKSFRRAPLFKFGYQVPRNHSDCVAINMKNENTKWQEAEALEMKQLAKYDTFDDLGKGCRPPEGYKWIPIESVYSGVVSLRSLRIVIFLAELNGLEGHAADVGNAYLEAKTKEKVYIVGGPGLGKLEGHTLTIAKALYGLRTSGLRWHERFADTLRDLGFFPSKADPDVWMRRTGDTWEYIATYVDDLAVALKK